MNMTFSYGFYTKIVTDSSRHVVLCLSLAILLLCFMTYRFLLSSCVCQLLIKLMMMTMMMMMMMMQITRRYETRERESVNAEDWRNVSIVIDRFIFCISVIILVTIALWMIAMSTYYTDIE